MPSYLNKFNIISIGDLKNSISFSAFEPGYSLFSAISKWIVNDFQFFLFLCAIVSVVPIMLLYVHESKHDLLTIALFVSIAPYTIFFSGLRQEIAIGMGVICYYFCKKDKIIPFMFFVVLAYSFHQSSVVLLLLYPWTHVRITKRWILPGAVLYVIALIYNKRIFSVLLGMNDKYESRYIISETGSYAFLFLLLLLVAFAFVIPQEDDDDLFGLRNILVLCLFIQCFAPINNVAMRLNYYFLIFIPITIPRIIDKSKLKYHQFAYASSIIFFIFFIFWFFKECYTGSNYLHTVPYEAFWEV